MYEWELKADLFEASDGAHQPLCFRLREDANPLLLFESESSQSFAEVRRHFVALE